MLVTVVLLVTAIVTGFWAYSKYRHNYWASRGVPTAPGAFPFFGHTPKFLSRKVSRWLYIDEVYRNYSDSRYIGFYELFKPKLMVCDPELVKDVLIKDFDHFVDRRKIPSMSKKDEVFQYMLTQASGSHWKSIRTKLSPTFTSGRMKRMFPLVGAKADDLVEYIHREMRSGPAVPVKKCFGLYTLEVISSCAFGMETNTLTQGKSTFFAMVKKIFKIKSIMIVKFILFMIFPVVFKVLKISLVQPEVVFFKDIVQETIKQREKTGMKRGDFLDLMMEARDIQDNPTSEPSKYPFNDLAITATSILFIFAGYDTTANTLSFTAFLLAQHPEEQQRLRRELRDIVREHGALNYQGLMEAQLLDACISEALRLHPPAHFTERQCVKDYTLPGTNVVVPKETIVSVPIWSLHRDPRYWSEPNAFRPDRFLPENKRGILGGTYLPFGLGPRSCIAQRFALLETKLALAKIVERFELSCVPGREEVEFEANIGVMRPKEDLGIVFTPLSRAGQTEG